MESQQLPRQATGFSTPVLIPFWAFLSRDNTAVPGGRKRDWPCHAAVTTGGPNRAEQPLPLGSLEHSGRRDQAYTEGSAPSLGVAGPASPSLSWGGANDEGLDGGPG